MTARLVSDTMPLRLPSLLFLFLLTGCSGDGAVLRSTQIPDPVARVEVSPASASLGVGESQQFTATTFSASGSALSGRAISWESDAPAVATISSTGLVAAVAAGTSTIRATSEGKSGTASLSVTTTPIPSNATVVVDQSTRYQTMTGWEGAAQLGELDCNQVAFAKYRTELVTKLVDELGINRVRLQIRSGFENPTDWFAQYISGAIDQATWRSHWWDIVNDNSDPRVINPAGFQWSQLDHKIDNVVTPIRQRLAARGERLYVNLTYTDFGASPFEHSSNPEEYAELMLAAFQHISSKYGWVPDAIEMILEPDNTANWRGAQIGAAIVATGDRLKAAGWTPAFIAPSNTNMTNAVTYFDALITVPRVKEYLTDIAYHRYGGVTTAALTGIASRGQQNGVRTGMLEHIGSGYQDLHNDIETGGNSSWQQFAFAYCANSDDGAQYYLVNDDVPSSPQLIMGSRTRFLRQYFLHVRLGAQRVKATSTQGIFDPLAFRNTTGKLTVVVKAAAGGSFSVGGLPGGTYGIFYTTAAAYDVALPDATISAGQNIPVSIPAVGVLTIFQR